jgi:hypothetical protein
MGEKASLCRDGKEFFSTCGQKWEAIREDLDGKFYVARLTLAEA